MKCPKCGAENPEKHKFCGECGTDLRIKSDQSRIELVRKDIPKSLAQKILLTKDSISKERRDVTVIFADISGFTSVSEQLDPEELTLLMNECFRKLSIMVYRYEGIIDKFIGDCIMAIFGAPITHEDDPERAILACLDMQHAIKEINQNLDKSLKKLNIHSGINTGQVIAGKVGSDLQMDYTVMGDTVNVAQRLKDISPAGSIYVGPETYQRTRHAFDFIGEESVQLKGKTIKVTPYEVIGKKWGSEYGLSAVHSDLVGREQEFSALKQSSENLLRNKSSINVIKGEIGVGKSRLLYEFKKFLTISAADIVLIDGRGVSYESSNPLRSFSDSLHRYLIAGEIAATENPEQVMKQKIESMLKDEAAEAAPYLFKLLDLTLDENQKEKVIHLDSHSLQLQIFLAFTTLFEKIAEKKPVVLIVDDIQWLDATSIELIGFLLPIVRKHTIAYYLSYRLGNINPIKNLLKTIATEYKDFAVEVVLKNLGTDDSVKLIDNLAGQAMDARLRNYIITKSGGNPFFIEEIVRRVLESGVLESKEPLREESIQIPGSIEAAITSRIDSLNKEAKYLLKIASITGRTFPQALLETVVKEKDIYQHIDELESSEFLIKTIKDKKTYYTFRHALFQEVTYNSLLKSERNIYHKFIAETIENKFKDEIENYLSVLAHHYYNCENIEKALGYSLKAGDESAKLYANEEALFFYNQALSIVQDERTRADVLEKIADIKLMLGDFPAASSHYQDAQKIHTDPLLKARLDTKHAKALIQEAQIDKAIDILRNTLISIKDKDSPIHAQAKYALARALIEFKLELDEGEKLVDEAIEISKRIKDVNAEAFGLRMKGHLAWRRGQPEKGIGVLEEAQRLYKSQNNLKQLAELYILFGSVLRHAGEIDKAIEYTKESLNICEKIGDKDIGTRILNNLGIYYAIKGDFRTAKQCYEKNLEERRRLGDKRCEGIVLYNLGIFHEYIGELDKAIEIYKQSEAIFEKINDVRNMITVYPTLAYNLVNKGDTERAVQYYEKAIALAKKTQDKGALGSVYTYYGSYYLRIGDVEKAMELFDRAKAVLTEAGDKLSLTELDLYFAKVYVELKDARALTLATQQLTLANERNDRVDAIVARKILGQAQALIEGNVEEGIKNIKHTVAAAEDAGFVEYEASCLIALGEVLIATKKSKQALEYFKKAKKIYEKMKATFEVEKVDKIIKGIS